MEKPTYYLDATAYKESGCMRRLFYLIVKGYRENKPAPALAYGSAMHLYIATLRGENNHQAGLIKASQYYMPYSMQWEDKEWRTLVHLMQSIGAYKNYYDTDSRLKSFRYRIAGEERLLIEQKFSMLIYENKHFKLMLCGTIDELGLYDGEITLVDRKTSSSYFRIEQALKVYQQSVQMMFYKYIAEKVLGLKNIKCVIEGIFLSSTAKTKVITSEVFEYEDWRMETFYNNLNLTVSKLIDNLNLWHDKGCPELFEEETFAMNFLCCDATKYAADRVGACRYFNLCSNSDKGIRDMMFKRDFIVKPWNPLLFGEEKE